MEQVISINNADDGWRKRYHYGVYTCSLLGPDSMVYNRSFIVIKDEKGVIVHFTRLHNYVGAYEQRVFRPLASDAENKMRYVCMMLNYILIDHYSIYKIDHVFKITKEALVCFFMDYALTEKKAGGYRGKQSIERCVSSVALFFRKLSYKYGGYVTLKKKDLYIEKQCYKRNGKSYKELVPDFQIRGIPQEKQIFRDVPNKVFKILLNLAIRYAPDIAFGIALQAFAGLRPGEVCNVRQEGSPKGKGLIITETDGRFTWVQIDLSHEYAMRSDGVICGRIKKERKQSVYPAYIEAFQVLYERHKKFLETRTYEKDYCPMFVNVRGMAMTYSDYRNRFTDLVEKHLRPLLLQHSDPECRLYGQMLAENKLGPQSIRHWFSVQLALRGEDVAQLQFWRGDTNPQSAFTYLQDKGDLINELAKTNELLADVMLKKGEEIFGKDGFLQDGE